MRQAYEAPVLEVEQYVLSDSIAKNCYPVVSNGPALGTHTQCEKYVDPFAVAASVESHSTFYADTPSECDCYTTGGDSGYWTS